MLVISSRDLARQAVRGPRYTSYPPATELRPIDPSTIDAELVTLGDAAVALYIHIPFCRSLCWYCGCNVIPTRDASRGDRYVDVLALEMTQLAARLGARPVIRELALGGGSPNFLAPGSLRTLITMIEATFDLAPDARRSIELDPRTTTAAQLAELATLGFTSLSIGVQDFALAVQDAIHRHQSRTQTAWLIAEARRHGLADLNLDIVYGLPCQTPTSFAATLDTVVELQPDRIALFGYAHLPDKLPHQRLVEKAGHMPDGEERATLLLAAIERLTAAGYVHIGLDHFARPGSAMARAASEQRLARTFQGYVEHRADTVLGLGVSAISTTPRVFWQHHVEVEAWESAVRAGALPVARGIVLDLDDQIRRALIERLMCDGRVELGPLEEQFAFAACTYFEAELARLPEIQQLATYDVAHHSIETTPEGRLLVRNVCMAFDRYLQPLGAQRFSATI